MKKVYYLATCDTCKRILNELQLPSEFLKHEIKQREIPVKELEILQKLAGSYEALFSKRAKLYKERGLKDEILTEDDYKNAAMSGGFTGNVVVGSDLATLRLPAQ